MGTKSTVLFLDGNESQRSAKRDKGFSNQTSCCDFSATFPLCEYSFTWIGKETWWKQKEGIFAIKWIHSEFRSCSFIHSEEYILLCSYWVHCEQQEWRFLLFYCCFWRICCFQRTYWHASNVWSQTWKNVNLLLNITFRITSGIMKLFNQDALFKSFKCLIKKDIWSMTGILGTADRAVGTPDRKLRNCSVGYLLQAMFCFGCRRYCSWHFPPWPRNPPPKTAIIST